MKTRLSIPTAALLATAALASAQSLPTPTRSGAALTLKSMLPSSQNAKVMLNQTPRHREWVGVPMGSSIVLAFVVYPERSDKAPIVMVTAPHEGSSPWVRAVSDQVAAEGFIAVAPDVLTNMGPDHGDSESFHTPEALAEALRRLRPSEIARRIDTVRAYALALPATDGKIASLKLDSHAGRINLIVDGGSGNAASTPRSTNFPLTAAGWPQALEYLNRETNNHPVAGANDFAPNNEHAEHMAAMMALAQGSSRGNVKSAAGDSTALTTSYAEKQPNLPAGYYTAYSALDKSKLRKEWVDIPLPAKPGESAAKLHTWVEYPAGEGKAGVVIVMQHATGMDEWIRAVADQLAQEGFIAVAPDLWSGTGNNGGGRETFEFIDDAMKAGAKITADEAQRRYKAARDWALKLPRANGKSGSMGFCAGGGNAFRFAGEVPELNAAVVYYGTPPDPDVMAKIKAPVIGFYGENDARVTSTVAPTITAMEKLGKVYEPHIYPKATHTFVLFQEMAGNAAAVNDSWPRAIAFLKKNLN